MTSYTKYAEALTTLCEVVERYAPTDDSEPTATIADLRRAEREAIAARERLTPQDAARVRERMAHNARAELRTP